MAYVVSLKQFDGPLDLLLTLISRAKVNIHDIFVSEITEQYMESMAGVDELDMDAASEFLAMAATLMEIKSRAMLPRPPKESEEDRETPEQALIRQLTEYKAFKEASQDMQRLEQAASALLTKMPEEYPLPPPEFELTGLTLDGLVKAFQKVLQRAEKREKRNIPPRPREIRRDSFTVQECMFRIQSRLMKGPMKFSALFGPRPSRVEVVTVFMALLEMLKLGRVSVFQESTFDEIELRPPQKTTAEPEADEAQQWEE